MPRKSKNFEEVREDFLNKIEEIIETEVLEENVVLDDFTIKELEHIIKLFEDTKSNFNIFSRLLMNKMREKIKSMENNKEQTKKIRINKKEL